MKGKKVKVLGLNEREKIHSWKKTYYNGKIKNKQNLGRRKL